MVRGNSERFQTFFTKGCSCVKCGIKGEFFAKEKRENDVSYHLNLYGFDSEGKEVLMTKDHIIPQSKGGKNHLDNYQPMCERCNKNKGNNMEE